MSFYLPQDLQGYRFIRQIASFPSVKKIYLFGSRARGDNQKRADVDLAIDCPHASPKEWQEILAIIDNVDTLLSVDCIRMDQQIDQKLREEILHTGKVIYDRDV